MTDNENPILNEKEIDEEERRKIFLQKWKEVLEVQSSPQPRKIYKPKFFYSILKYILTFLFIFFVSYFGLNYKAYFQKAKYTYNVEIKKQTLPTLPSIPEGDYVNLRDSIIIPKINVDAPIIWEVEDKDILTKLNEGVVHFKGTALPNEPGNVVLTGHSSTYPWQKTKYGQVFSLLEKLEPGDNVIIVYNKKRYLYEVKSKKIIRPEDIQVLNTKSSNLTLITCWPVGTSLKRLVVYADLVKKPMPPSKELLLPTLP